MQMKYLLFLFLSGCATKGVNTTLFLKEENSVFYNLEGQDCLESGYTLAKGPDGITYRLITYYSNCSVHRERSLKEYEIKDWQPKFTLETK